MNDKRSKFDVPHKDECPECEGTGHSRESAPALGKKGSGCPVCLGIGRVKSETA